MPTLLVGAVVVFIALFLGACALRAQAIRTLSGQDAPAAGLLHITTLVILASWFANAAWAVHARVGYGLGVIALALIASQLASARTASQWQGVRYWIAIATAASAGLLWSALPIWH